MFPDLKFTYYPTVREGAIPKSISRSVKEALRYFDGRKIEITIRKARSMRTSDQNALYWVYVTILSQELGYRKEEIHEILKYMFLKTEVTDEKTGEMFTYIRSTTMLTKSEYSDFISEVQRWSAEHGVILPEPNSQIEMSL